MLLETSRIGRWLADDGWITSFPPRARISSPCDLRNRLHKSYMISNVQTVYRRFRCELTDACANE